MAVADDVDEFLRVICDIQGIKEMKVSFCNCVVAGVWVGVATMTSGLCFGSLGLAIGAIYSGVRAAILMNGKFESVPYILINKTSNEQKTHLVEAVGKVLRHQNILAFADFEDIVDTNDSTAVKSIIRIVKRFLKKELKATI